MSQLTRNGTQSRVYGGDPNLVHIADGERRKIGADIAQDVDEAMRENAMANEKPYEGPLCPGCYMIALFNAACELAVRNGQPLTELGATMAHAFSALARNPSAAGTEEIAVILDPEDVEPWGPCSPWPHEWKPEAIAA